MQNYEDGDEIVLIGFSRGAFTARSIGGLIGDIGLLTKKGLGSFYPIFKDWMNQVNASYKPEIGTAEWPLTRPKFTNPSYIPKLVEVLWCEMAKAHKHHADTLGFSKVLQDQRSPSRPSVCGKR